MQQGSPSESPPSPNMNVPSPKHHATYTRQQNGSSNSSSNNNTLGSTYNAFQYPVRNDAKLGGVNNNLIAFVRNRDIWVATTEGYEIQLTTSSLQRDDPTLSSGTSEHVMQVFTNTYVYHVLSTHHHWIRKNFKGILAIIGHHHHHPPIIVIIQSIASCTWRQVKRMWMLL